MRWYDLLMILALCASGWLVRGWYEDSIRLEVTQKQQEIIEKQLQRESVIAKVIEERLQELRANERTILKEVPKIITRDVYRNVCLDNSGLQLIRDAANGNTTKSIEEMP